MNSIRNRVYAGEIAGGADTVEYVIVAIVAVIIGAALIAFGNKMQQQITEAKEAQEELQQMVISLKNIAKQKLESGETAAAKAILSQVQQYAPDDDEIKTLLHNLEEEVQ